MKFYFLIHKCTRTPTDTLAPEALSHTVAHEELLKMMEIFLMHQNPREKQQRDFAATQPPTAVGSRLFVLRGRDHPHRVLGRPLSF